VHKALFIIPLVIPLLFAIYLYEDLTIESDVGAAISHAFIRGHVEVIAAHPDGTVFSYQQGENLIVTHGENCVLKMMFGAAGGDTIGTVVCIGEINAGWHFIGLGETGSASTPFVDGDTDLRDPADSAGLSAVKVGTVTFTNSTDTSFGSVLISANFVNTGASEVVNEAGLFNGTAVATNGMLAGNNFVNVTLNTNDDITINWTVEVGDAPVP